MTLYVDTLELPVMHLIDFRDLVALDAENDLMGYTPESLIAYLATNMKSAIDVVPWLRHFHGYKSRDILQYFQKIRKMDIDIVLHIHSEEDLMIMYYLMEYMEFKVYKRFASGETNYKADGELISRDRQLVKITRRKIKIV
eukprot:NODE_115_length_19014_cov_0.489664.p10 type:complete len:141 gc:universal NODE_115_length_19014_cov_0.489664:15388-14966(-)